MSKKKMLIIILFILIVLILIITSLLINNKREKNKINNKNNNIEEIEKEESEEEETTIEDKTTYNNPQPSQEYNNIKPIQNNNVNNQNVIPEESPQEKPPPAPTYSCPADYTLDGAQCINSYPATLGCTGNRHDFSDGTVSGCVNLSEGYFAEEGTCPDGYGELKVISLGAEPKYQCLPVYPKELVCLDDYNLQDSTCLKIIPATINWYNSNNNKSKVILWIKKYQ